MTRTKYFLLLCNIQPGAGAHLASCLMSMWVLSKGKSVRDVNLTRLFSLQPMWNYICVSDRDKCSCSSHSSSIEEDSTEQPQFDVLITDRSHFTQFLFALFYFNTKIYTAFEFVQ